MNFSIYRIREMTQDSVDSEFQTPTFREVLGKGFGEERMGEQVSWRGFLLSILQLELLLSTGILSG
jgi:hypothetical protein